MTIPTCIKNDKEQYVLAYIEEDNNQKTHPYTSIVTTFPEDCQFWELYNNKKVPDEVYYIKLTCNKDWCNCLKTESGCDCRCNIPVAYPRSRNPQNK